LAWYSHVYLEHLANHISCKTFFRYTVQQLDQSLSIYSWRPAESETETVNPFHFNIVVQDRVNYKIHSLHSILQSLMQLSVHQSFISTTCFGHTGPSSGTIIAAQAVSL
jgi:hypothetical protein